MKKSELLKWLQEEYQKWQEFLDQIDPMHMDQPGLNGNRSVKDIAAHLTGWRELKDSSCIPTPLIHHKHLLKVRRTNR